MKKYHKYIALAALTISFAACTQDEDFIPQGDGDAIKISASIGALQTRVSYDAKGYTTFDKGDQIRVKNTLRTSKNIATYTLTDEGWNTADAFVWSSTSLNQFEAWYPVTDGTSFDTFTLPTEQNSSALLGAADWMTIGTKEIEKPSDKTLKLHFLHMLTKVTVNVTSWGSEYDGTDKTIEDVKIYSLATDIVQDREGLIGQIKTASLTPIAPLADGNSYTAIVCPGLYSSDQKFMTFTVNGTDNLTVLAKVSSPIEIEAAKHYTFNLTVGKETATISSVEVIPWAKKEIVGGVAEEVPCVSSIDETTLTLRVSEIATSEEITSAVSNALDAGCTTLNITLSADAPGEMFTAIRRAICDTECVEDGSINLILKGVTVIPDHHEFEGQGSSIFGQVKKTYGTVENVTQLSSVNLPDVTEIGAQAFYGCSNLTSITAPKVQSIGNWGLQRTAITSIDMPLLKEAGLAAFQRTALTEVSLPSLETAEAVAFGGCEQLRTVDLPKLQNLSQQLFIDCTSLVSVNVPAATSMSNEVFRYCSELVSITLSGVTELLTYGGFAGCTKLENITLGSVITKIDAGLFAGEALSSGITLTLHPDQANAEGDLKATAGTNVEWGGFTWKEVKFSATE